MRKFKTGPAVLKIWSGCFSCDTENFRKIKEFPADHPSGIFFAYRAYRFGM
jgi:hypothetical protein